MKTPFLVLILLFSGLANLPAAEKWYTVGQNANDVALKEHKRVLSFYKRCNWADQWSDLIMHDACTKLDEEVFASPEFQEFAKQYLVLEVLDYSRGVNTDDKSMQMLHQSLQFWEPQIKTYPTVILHNTDWNQLGRQEGYKTGGSKAFMDWLQKTISARAGKPPIPAQDKFAFQTFNDSFFPSAFCKNRSPQVPGLSERPPDNR